MRDVSFTEYNAVGELRDLEHAREALEALQRAGIDDEQISLFGRPVQMVDLTHDEAGTHQPVGGHVGWEIAAGATTGAVVGGVSTALVAAAVAALASGVGLAATAAAGLGLVAGGGAGGTVGAILGGEAGLRTNGSWQQAIATIRQGAILLAVHASEPAPIETATRALEAVEPMGLRRVNTRGQPVAAAS